MYVRKLEIYTLRLTLCALYDILLVRMRNRASRVDSLVFLIWSYKNCDSFQLILNSPT